MDFQAAEIPKNWGGFSSLWISCSKAGSLYAARFNGQVFYPSILVNQKSDASI